MKSLRKRPPFQAPTRRHYHRSRKESRGWDQWVDPARKPGALRRRLWLAIGIILAGICVALLFAL